MTEAPSQTDAGPLETPDFHSSAHVPIHVRELRFNDGTRLPLEPGHVVVLVGANNVGKSSALRDISSALRTEPRRGHKVINNVTTAEAPDHPARLVEWVRTRFPKFRPGPHEPWVYGTNQGTVNENQLDTQGTPDHRVIQQIKRVVTFVANAQERLNLTKPAQPVDLTRNAPSTPIQSLYSYDDKVEKLSEASYSAFGDKITYDHLAGSWRLRLGEPAIEPAITGRNLFPTPETRAAIEDLPAVEEQGDGLKSYLGVLLELLAERHLFIVLDEPEAFLHPPQARRLATEVMRTKQAHAQLFVATHDPNFVRGLLDVDGAHLSLVRVQRSGATNPMTVIAPETVKAVAGDPVLRHSNILDSLFSTAAVVCEAEPDCHLYESTILDNDLLPAGTTMHFAGSSDKGRVKTTCQMLTRLGVPTAAVVDFDLLRVPTNVSELLVALGHRVDPDLEQRIMSLTSQLADLAKAKTPTKAEFVQKIQQVLRGSDDAPLSSRAAQRISELASESANWSALKRHGLNETRGELNEQLTDLLSQLAGMRLHIVPVGELEGWFRNASGGKGVYVADVLERSMHKDPVHNAAIVRFAESVIESLT